MVPCRYERVNDYNEGLAVVEQNWRKGYVDTDGYEVSPVSYREAEMFRNGRLAACRTRQDSMATSTRRAER